MVAKLGRERLAAETTAAVPMTAAAAAAAANCQGNAMPWGWSCLSRAEGFANKDSSVTAFSKTESLLSHSIAVQRIFCALITVSEKADSTGCCCKAGSISVIFMVTRIVRTVKFLQNMSHRDSS